MASKIKKGDTVIVISGKDKGKKGRVLSVLTKKNRVLVEGVNIVKKHVRPTSKNPKGGIITQEAGIHISNVMLVCPSCGQPTRVGFALRDEGVKVRKCKKCESDIQ